MIIEVTYPTYGDRGEFLGADLVGYLGSKSEARKALRGLCPWDFNSMWGPSSYERFCFSELPGTLDSKDKEDRVFIEAAKKSISKARDHAKETKRSWHKRAPLDW